MNELEQLKVELRNKMNELSSITVRTVNTVGYDAVQDRGGKDVELTSYTDPERATKLQREIEKIQQLIQSFPVKEAKFTKGAE